MNFFLVIILILVSTIIGSIGSIFLKKGSEHFHIRLSIKGFLAIIRNWQIMVGLFLYALSTVAFIYLLKSEDLSILYPMTSISYVFIAVLSFIFLKEKINRFKIVGIAFIILGVVFVTMP